MKKMYINYKYKIYLLHRGTTIFYNILLVFFASSFVYGIKSIVSLNNGKRNKSPEYFAIFIISLIFSIILGKYYLQSSDKNGHLGADYYSALTVVLIFIVMIIFIGSYVYYDAKKRGMAAIMWTIISVFIPYFIGFLIYIIARGENKKRCPVCGKSVDYQYKVCPFCGTELKHKCPYCGKDISPDWNVCPYCSNKLK